VGGLRLASPGTVFCESWSPRHPKAFERGGQKKEMEEMTAEFVKQEVEIYKKA
jgi:hypothetical protein